MRVASKFEEKYKGERCPKCSETFSNFMVINDILLACYKCGTVFVRKSVRNEEYANVKTQLAIQVKEKESATCLVPPHLKEEAEGAINKDEVETFKCEVCGKPCKSKAGLAAHMRSHDG